MRKNLLLVICALVALSAPAAGATIATQEWNFNDRDLIVDRDDNPFGKPTLEVVPPGGTEPKPPEITEGGVLLVGVGARININIPNDPNQPNFLKLVTFVIDYRLAGIEEWPKPPGLEPGWESFVGHSFGVTYVSDNPIPDGAGFRRLVGRAAIQPSPCPTAETMSIEIKDNVRGARGVIGAAIDDIIIATNCGRSFPDPRNIPEPSSASLAAVSLLLFLGFRFRRPVYTLLRRRAYMLE